MYTDARTIERVGKPIHLFTILGHKYTKALDIWQVLA